MKPERSTPVSLCMRCARTTRTCCQERDIYVTPSDVARISAATETADFFEYRKARYLDYAEQEDDPVWSARVFRSDGRRRVLRQNAADDCLFLSDEGCRLDFEARPLICRLHPRLFNHQGLSDSISPDCPLQLLGAEERIEEAIEGCSLEDACRWHRMLYEEISQEVPASCALD